MRTILLGGDGYWDDQPVKKTTHHMVFLIFAVFLLVPLVLLSLLVSAGNFMYGDYFSGIASGILGVACAGAVYYLIKKYRE